MLIHALHTQIHTVCMCRNVTFYPSLCFISLLNLSVLNISSSHSHCNKCTVQFGSFWQQALVTTNVNNVFSRIPFSRNMFLKQSTCFLLRNSSHFVRNFTPAISVSIQSTQRSIFVSARVSDRHIFEHFEVIEVNILEIEWNG